jgi:hypothetical protein
VSHQLQISAAQAGPALTPSQKRFNTLIRQIDQARNTLAAWKEGIEAYRQAHAKVLEPLRQALLAGQRQWAFALDAALARHKWSKTDSTTLRELLCEAAGELLEGDREDAELKALFDRHADVDFETEQREAAQAMKDLAEAMTGLDLGDDDGIASEADLFQRLQQGFDAQAAADAEREEAKKARRASTAAQKRRDAEAKQATQSVREVYRKLASALHPDREPDAQQREAKTALMQRVNQAYKANDLLALLELQLQIEQIDASHIANAGEQRLKHYNQVLAEQLGELKREAQDVEMAFRMQFGLQPGWGLNPAKLGQVIQQISRQWQAERHEQQRGLRMLDDVAATKRWLKQERRVRRDDELDVDFPAF